MTRSELIESLAARHQLPLRDVELSVKTLIEQMSATLAQGGRIEVRGFGSFSVRYRPPRVGRNPRTGETVGLSGKFAPHFKPGKALRERVNAGLRAPSEQAGRATRAAAGNADSRRLRGHRSGDG